MRATFSVAFLLLCLVPASTGTAHGQKFTQLLDTEDVWLLVMNIPEVMEVECRKGCPDIEFTPVGRDRIWAMVRNTCPQSGNGTMGRYTIDLRDGRIWSGVDPITFIDSRRLQRLRKALLSRHQARADTVPQK